METGHTTPVPSGTGRPGPAAPARHPSRPARLLRGLLIGLVRFYQGTLGLMLPDSCRFSPTCSEYFIRAVEKHGAIKGTWLGLRRILRCNPLCKGGHDPVP